MTRPALVKLLIAQSVLLVLALWAGVYFARDEYLLATARDAGDDEPTPPAAVTEPPGLPSVRLSAAAQRNVGIEVARPEPAERGREAAVGVQVLDAQPLAEWRGRLQAARHDAAAAQAQALASQTEQRRVQALYDDDRNASQRAFELASAQAAADTARARSAQAALQALRDAARASWGAALARALDADGDPLIGRLASGREVLLRAALRSDDDVAAGTRLLLTLPGRTTPRTAEPLGAAGPAAHGGDGGSRALLFRADGSGLLPGQRLTGQLRGAGEALQAGALVPASAIVWHAGLPWIYVRESGEPQAVRSPSSEVAAPGPSASASAALPPAQRDDDDAPKARPGAPAASARARPASVPAAAATPSDGGQIFQRRAVPEARRAGDRWFLPGYAEDDPVVVRGAQLLLSEELKFQIRNENDD